MQEILRHLAFQILRDQESANRRIVPALRVNTSGYTLASTVPETTYLCGSLAVFCILYRNNPTPNVVCQKCSRLTLPIIDMILRHPAAGRGTAATTRCIDSVRRSIVMRSLQLTGKVHLDERKFDMFRLWTERRAGPRPSTRRIQIPASWVSAKPKWRSMRRQPAAIWRDVG